MTTEPLYIDNSTLKAVAACSTQALLRYGLHFATSEEKAALNAGTAFHAAMEAHFKGHGKDFALDAMENGMVCGLCGGDGHIDDRDINLKCERCKGTGRSTIAYRAWAEENVPLDDRLSYGNISRIVDFWCEMHPLHQLPFQVEPELVEVGFAFPLTDEGDIIFCGRIDGVATMDNQWYILEHKSTGRITPDWLKSFHVDSQLSGYLWAAQQHVGRQFVGAFLNAVEFSKIPDSDRKCSKHGVVYSECGHLHTNSQMVVVTRTPEQLEGWRRDAIKLARRYQYLLKRYPNIEYMDFVPQEGTFQNACRFCGFFDYCRMGRPADYIVNNLTFDKWEPYARATEERDASGRKP